MCCTNRYWFEFFIDMAFIADIMFNFRTGYVIDDGRDSSSKDDAAIEFDRKRVAWHYGTSWFVHPSR